MKTLISKLSLCSIFAVALVQFASLRNANADSSPQLGSNPGLVSEEFQRAQDANNPLLDQPFPMETHTSGLPASGLPGTAIDSPISSFAPVPAVNVKAAVANAPEVTDADADQLKHLSIAAIPEPSSWVLLSLGAGTLLAFGYILRQHNRTA